MLTIQLFRIIGTKTERFLPFDLKIPNAASLNARAELEAGKGRKFKTIKALMADLNTKN